MSDWSSKDQFQEDLLELIQDYQYSLNPLEICEILVNTSSTVMIYASGALSKYQMIDWINTIYDLFQ